MKSLRLICKAFTISDRPALQMGSRSPEGLNELNPYGRLCFIDSSGSKNSGSAGGDGVQNYTITPINPENYELLQKELGKLIEERNSFYESPGFYAKENKKKMDAILNEKNEFEFRKRMNY